MKIQDLLDMRKVVELVGDGYLRERVHPDHPTLRTLGYTEKAQWERMWVHETLTCRGLIYEAESGEIIARPYPKFFNHGEYGQDHLLEPLDLHEPVEVTDKMDGSLGIIYRNPFTGEWAVATRGSFDSDQARLANDQFLPQILQGWQDGGIPMWQPIDGITYLTEIIHPSNRIVLDYGRLQGLSLLGGVHIESGAIYGPGFDQSWPDHKTETFPDASLAGALERAPRPNAEGLVVRYLRTGQMVKIKQEDYVRLHKIVTGLSDKAVWEHLAEGKKITDMLEVVPDEFHEWVLDTAQGFVVRMVEIKDKAFADYVKVVNDLEYGLLIGAKGPGYRKEFAQRAKKTERPGLLFQLLDGRDIDESVWKELKPVGVRYMSSAAREEALA